MQASRLFPTLVLLAACLGPARAADDAHAADRAAIQQVVQQFQDAIKAHDGKTLGSLFLQDHDSWISVLDGRTWKAAKARFPNAEKYRRSSWKRFAAMIQDDKGSTVEERFYNVRIETNGTVGSVYFDFDFLDNGKVTNHGAESWQMVHAEDGWKISSMLFSIDR